MKVWVKEEKHNSFKIKLKLSQTSTALVSDCVWLLWLTGREVYQLSSLKWRLGCVLIYIKAGKSVLKSSPVCRRRKSWNVQLHWHWRADVLVKNQERASAEQVTLFLTSQPHQKFFQVSFCVAKDDNGESISAWNEKKPSVCPRGERFHTRQPSLNFRHSSAPFCVRKRRLLTDFFFSLYKKVRGEYNRTIMPLQTLLTLFISPCRRGVIWRCAHAGLMFSLLASGSFYSHFMRWCMCVGVFVHDCPIIQQLILKHRGQNLKERAVLANMLILFIFSPYWFAFDPLYSVCMCVWREEN